jgi:A/G-specific adenine glycosylase
MKDRLHSARVSRQDIISICVNPCSSVAFQKNQFRAALTRWYHANGRLLPWRQTRDPYAILVSEFMLQQTQIAAVVPYYNMWLRRFPDFAALAQAPESDILHAWQGLGYYARARNLHAVAKTVQHRHGGGFPRSPAVTSEFPGVGRYTANAVATFAFDRPVPIIETNTARVLARLFDFHGAIDRAAGREELWKRARTLVPKYSARIYNSALVDLGALICSPRKPKCGICPVKRFCRTKDPETLPIKKGRPPTLRLTEHHAFIAGRKTILLQQANHRWCGMWILPPLLGRTANQRPVYRSTFSFTNHRVALNVYALPRKKIHNHSQRWMRIDSLESIPVPSPHRKALQILLHARRGTRLSGRRT